MKRTSEQAFENAIFSDFVLKFIQKTQAKEWDTLAALQGDKTGDRLFWRV